LKVLLEDRELVPLPTEPTGAQFAGSENVAQLGKNVSELNKFKAMMDQVIDKFSVPFLLSQSKLPYIVNSAKSGNIWIRLGAQNDNLLASKACREAGESAQLDFRLPTVEQAAAEVNLLHTSDVGSVVDNGWLSAKAWAAWSNSKTARDGRIFWVLDPKIGAGGKFDVGTSTWIDSRVGSADVVCVYDRSKKVVAGSN